MNINRHKHKAHMHHVYSIVPIIFSLLATIQNSHIAEGLLLAVIFELFVYSE